MEGLLTRRQFTAGVSSVCIAGRARATDGEFNFHMYDYTSELPRGDTWSASFVVENEGREYGEAAVTLYFEGLDTEPTEDVRLGPEETDEVTFTAETSSLGLGSHDCRVETEGDHENFEVTIFRPATYDLSDVTLEDETVVRGTDTTIEGVVKNVGDTVGEHPVRCFVDGEEKGFRHFRLDSRRSNEFRFSIYTDDLEAGEYDVSVTTPDDTVTRTLTVVRPAHFKITDWDIPTEVVRQGRAVTVSTTVENTGMQDGQTEVALLIDGEEVGEESLFLRGSESETVTFQLSTDDVSIGKHEIVAATEDTKRRDIYTISESASFDVTAVDCRPERVALGKQFEAVADIRNEEDVRGERTVTLVIDGDRVDESSLALAGGTADEVGFLVDTRTLETGTNVVSVSVGDSSARTEVSLYRNTTSTSVGGDTGTTTASNGWGTTTDDRRTTRDPTSDQTADGAEPIVPKVPRLVEWTAAISSITGMTILGLKRLAEDES